MDNFIEPINSPVVQEQSKVRSPELITPEVGKVYIVKHSSGMIKARFLYVQEHTFSNYRNRTRWIFQNLSTGRDIRLKSRVKILREVQE